MSTLNDRITVSLRFSPLQPHILVSAHASRRDNVDGGENGLDKKEVEGNNKDKMFSKVSEGYK